MMGKLVIFDLDGTLADTSEGILNSHRHAHLAMGQPVPSEDVLFSVIGGPLLETYRTVFKFPDAEAVEAVRIYRAWYAEHGIHQARLYPGMEAVLDSLNEHSFCVGIATLKAEQFAKTMMEEMGIATKFHMICGMNSGDTLSKADLIRKCISIAGIAPEATCMVGDSVHDFKGAQECNVSFVGVQYGFGFHDNREYPFPLCDTCEKILNQIHL